MPLSTTVDNSVLNHLFGKVTWSATGDARWIGLSSTTPTKAGGNITEPVGNGYARQQLTAAIVDTASNSATQNNTAVTFPQATGDWSSGSNQTHMVCFDASTSGNFLFFKSLDVAKPVLSGDTAVFEAGDLDFTMGGTA